MPTEMTPVDDELLALAAKKFGELSEAEQRMLRAAPEGAVAMCANEGDPANDPGMAENKPDKGGWGREREIRAELIRWLCVNKDAAGHVDLRGPRVFGAKITGKLDLSFATVAFPLVLCRCRILEDCDLSYLEIRELDFGGTHTKKIRADGLKILGGVFLNGKFSAEGEVRLLGAKIGGDLTFSGASLKESAGAALSADGIEVSGSIFLDQQFSAEGEVRLPGARVGNQLICSDGTFKNPNGRALSAAWSEVEGGVFLQRVSAEGEVRLSGAKIGRALQCNGATFKQPAGRALDASATSVAGRLSLLRVIAQGEVWLSGAKIDDDLVCNGATFKKPDGCALIAERLDVAGPVRLNDSTVDGEIRVVGSKIGGSLECTGSTFNNRDGQALSADMIDVNGSVFLRQLRANGKVKLLVAKIRGDLDCSGARLISPGESADDFALAANRSVIGGGAIFDGIHAEGKIALTEASVSGPLRLRRWNEDAKAVIELQNTGVGALYDDEAMRNRVNLKLSGFTYTGISDSPTDASSRLRWLDRQAEFTPQPYRQVAKFLQERGDDDGAKKVLYELARRKRAEERKVLPGWRQRVGHELIDGVFRIAVGYGLYPIRSLVLLSAVFIGGLVLYGRAEGARVMAPVEERAYSAFKCNRSFDWVQPFSPAFYTLENCLPLVKFGQDDKWQPDPNQKPVLTMSGGFLPRLWRRWVPAVWLLKGYRRFMILAGWVLATFFAGAVTGIMKKE